MSRPAQPPQRPTGKPRQPTRAPNERGGPFARVSPRASLTRSGRWYSWPVWILTRFAAPLVLLLAIGLGVGYVRLLNGPISLKFLAAPIARAIAADLPGFDVAVEDAAVLLGPSNSLEFRLTNVRLADRDGAPIARAPLAAVRLNTNALWQLRIAPARIILIEPRLLVLYTREHGLSLSVARSADAIAPPPAASQPAQPGTAPTQASAAAAPKPIELARMIAEATSRHRRLAGTSFLKGIGLRDATIIFDHSGRQTLWRVREAEFGINQNRQGSLIGGDIAFASSVGGSTNGVWRTSFVVQDTEGSDAITLKANLQDLVPRSIAETIPEFSALAAFDFPVNGTVNVDLSQAGAVLGANIGLDLRRGAIMAGAGPSAATIPFDSGRIDMRYAPATSGFELLPSRVAWGGANTATIVGRIGLPDAANKWSLDVTTQNGVLAAEEFGVGPTPIEAFRLRASFDPNAGGELHEARLKLAGGEVGMTGRLPSSGSGQRLMLQGRVSPMSLATLKTMWPSLVAPGARKWAGRQLQQGRVVSGTFSVEDTASDRTRPGAPTLRSTVAFEGADIRLIPKPGMPPVDLPRALLRLDGQALEITAPDATIVTSPQRRLPLKTARLTTADVMAPNATGDLTFRVLGGLPAALELIEQQAARRGRPITIPGENVDGKVDAQAKISVPFGDALSADDVRMEVKGRITDGKARAVIGNHDINGASIAFDVSEQLAEAKGDLLVGGVAAKLSWQRIFNAADEEQPPLRLRATLDTADRTQLGLDVNDLVQGEVPIELTVTPRANAEPLVQVRAELTNAELLIESLAWKKPPGRQAILQFDVAKVNKQRTELQNFKVVGDDVAIGGLLVLDGQSKVREFAFPGFTLNVVSKLEVQGVLRPDNVWDVKANGTTFDGRDFFQTLFSVGQIRDKPLPVRPNQPGLDLKVEVDTVLGYQEISLKQLKMQMSKRGGRLVGLSARGVVDGGKQMDVGLQPAAARDPRRLIARTDDAGQLFRLVGFYPNMQGGRMRLDVNLDGSGPAEKTGMLQVEQFEILGDPVSYDTPGADNFPGNQRPKRTVERPVLQFDSMRAPFSVGYGQFVLEDADLRGPVLGVVLKGKADFRAKTIDLGGTYVPLQGLNSIVGYFPIFGQLLAGPKGEGVFGTTFAIQGPMARPQVLFNPVSGVLPGILREMMQMTNPTPRVTPRGEEAKPAPAAAAKAPAAVRSSSEPASTASPAKRSTKAETKVDTDGGWSSSTTKPVGAAPPPKKIVKPAEPAPN